MEFFKSSLRGLFVSLAVAILIAILMTGWCLIFENTMPWNVISRVSGGAGMLLYPVLQAWIIIDWFNRAKQF